MPGLVAAVTVTVAVPFTPSLVAVIIAEPAATAVTSPLEFTVATAGVLDAQVTVRPVSVLPPASLRAAASCRVLPTKRLVLVGLTTTDATDAGVVAVTVRAAAPVTPPLVAVIVAVPAATAVASPLPLIVAMVLSLDAHVTGCPVSTFPAESLSDAVNWAAPPAATLADAGLKVTDATAALGGLASLPVATVRSSIHMY